METYSQKYTYKNKTPNAFPHLTDGLNDKNELFYICGITDGTYPIYKYFSPETFWTHSFTFKKLKNF